MDETSSHRGLELLERAQSLLGLLHLASDARDAGSASGSGRAGANADGRAERRGDRGADGGRRQADSRLDQVLLHAVISIQVHHLDRLKYGSSRRVTVDQSISGAGLQYD